MSCLRVFTPILPCRPWMPIAKTVSSVPRRLRPVSLVPRDPQTGIPPPGRRRTAAPVPLAAGVLWHVSGGWVTTHNPLLNPGKLQSTQQVQCRETSPKTLAAMTTTASQDWPIFRYGRWHRERRGRCICFGKLPFKLDV